MRVKLSDKYPEKREAICKQIISILEVNEDNGFLLCDLDADLEKQQKNLVLHLFSFKMPIIFFSKNKCYLYLV